MKEIFHEGIAELAQVHNRHEGYEYIRREFIPKEAAAQSRIAYYEIPPGKSGYPYHYHIKNEESFYILSGQGLLRTPSGERTVKAGDFMFFPTGEDGAHKLTNTSDTEMLVYLDFDTQNSLEVAFYPDSGKVGIWGHDINKLYKAENDVAYYEGE